MKPKKLYLIFSALILVLLVAVLKKDIFAQQITSENTTLAEEFKRMLPAVQQGRKSLSVMQGEKAILSEVRNIGFGGDYFVMQDSVWNGRSISTRRMFIKTDEIIWLVEDEASVVVKLRN